MDEWFTAKVKFSGLNVERIKNLIDEKSGFNKGDLLILKPSLEEHSNGIQLGADSLDWPECKPYGLYTVGCPPLYYLGYKEERLPCVSYIEKPSLVYNTRVKHCFLLHEQIQVFYCYRYKTDVYEVYGQDNPYLNVDQRSLKPYFKLYNQV